MLYIVCALKPEAQAFVDRYKLKKEALGKYKIFKNDSITLIISGLGVENSTRATQTLINHFDVTDDDVYLNVGICGADETYKIGELINVSTIVYKGLTYEISDSADKTIHCLNQEAVSNEFELVDMESFGFYQAVIHSPAIQNRYVLKVVSDHFEPKKVTKEKSKTLIFNAIDAINYIMFSKDEI